MEHKEKGSNFYQLTAQVLNDKNLNHAEKITMAILYGLSEEDGTCYPSNEWLCEKLDLSERPVRIILEKLEKNNYIRREIIQCVNNPFKRYRIIHVSCNFKLSLPGAENSRSVPVENSRSVGSKTAGIIDKKELIDKKEREGAQPPASPPPLPPFIYKRVKMDQKKAEQLLKDLGSAKMNEMMDRLDEYADINPKRFNQYACHAAVIRKWLREDGNKPNGKSSSSAANLNKELANKIEKKYPVLIQKNYIVVGSDYIEFNIGMHCNRINFTDHGFQDTCLNFLRKMNLDIIGL